ncbi:MAG: hypothetical protein IKF42_08370, partial [Mogibacterium sp.]|nr:hypothetical protein [Mogibacterium sp.]
ERMKEDQKEIYYACGDSIEAIKELPQLEKVLDKGYEVLYFTDSVDEFMAGIIASYDGKPFKSLQKGELDFDICMSEHMAKLDREGENLEHMKALCRMLSDEVDDISEIKASVYLERMKELEKGGVRFVNVRMFDVRKRRTGAILSAIAVIMVSALLIIAVLLSNSEDPAPWVVIAVFVVIFGGIIVGVVVALVQRLDEVKRGEIDEASKY